MRLRTQWLINENKAKGNQAMGRLLPVGNDDLIKKRNQLVYEMG
jgi:hypothetical protein